METATLPEPIVLTTQPPGSPEWLKAHKGKIGSNDLAVLMGIPRFGRTRLRLWGELTEKCEREDISKKPEVRRGVLLEDDVIQLFQDETGHVVLPSPGLIQHPTLSFIACTPDGRVGKRPIETKTVGQWARKDWATDIPLGTQVQGHGHAWVLCADGVFWAAFCLDAKLANAADDEEDDDKDDDKDESEEVLPAAKGDPLLLWAERERRDDLLETLGNEAVDFWENNVLKDIPPDPGSDIKTVNAIWKREFPHKVITLTAELELAWMRSKEIGTARGLLKKEQDPLKAKIKVAMADAHYGVTPGNVVLRCEIEARKDKICPHCAKVAVPGVQPRILREVKKVGA